MDKGRKYPRYLTSTSGILVGRIQNSKATIRLQTFGQGGCSFVGTDPEMELIPPKKIRLTFELLENHKVSLHSEIDGALIYIRPVNATFELQYGVKFDQAQVEGLGSLASRIERYASQGFVDRA